MRFTHARTTAGYQSPHQVVIGGTLWHRLGLVPIAADVITGLMSVAMTAARATITITARRPTVAITATRATIAITGEVD